MLPLGIAGAFVLFGAVAALRPGSLAEESGLTFAAQTVRRYFLCAVATLVLAACAWTTDAGELEGHPWVLALYILALLLCILALVAIVRTSSDYVRLTTEHIAIQQVGNLKVIPWQSFDGVEVRSPYSLAVLTKEAGELAQCPPTAARSARSRLPRKVNITTLHLTADQALIKRSLEEGAQRWRSQHSG